MLSATPLMHSLQRFYVASRTTAGIVVRDSLNREPISCHAAAAVPVPAAAAAGRPAQRCRRQQALARLTTP